MKTKIVGILVCTLLISTVAFSAAGVAKKTQSCSFSTWSEDTKLLAADDNSNGNDAGSAYLFSKQNQAPTAPEIDGPASGKPGRTYTYNFTSTDPDGDNISYYVRWDDGTTPWTNYLPSGDPYTEAHSWTFQGTYTIESKARDEYGAESDWTTLEVAIPVNEVVMNSFAQKLFARFTILRQLVGL